jgi:phage gpG-like protein
VAKSKLWAAITTDLSDWNKLRKKIQDMGEEAYVKVGVLTARGGNDTHPDAGISLIELATIHEFGAPAANIPERSYLRSTVQNKQEAIVEMSNRIGKKLVMDEDFKIEDGLNALGTWAVGQVKNTIVHEETEGPEPQELKPATIARKGSSTPLVDTGRLLNSITHEVVVGGKSIDIGDDVESGTEGGEE